jgi:hypothetical protein
VGVSGIIVSVHSPAVPAVSVSLASSFLQPCRNVRTNSPHSTSDTLGRPNASAALIGCPQSKAVRDEVNVVRRVDTAGYLGAKHCLIDMLVRWLPLLSSRRLPSGLVRLARASGADLDVAAGGDMRESRGS